jgi:hypothetical protein
MYLSGVSWPLAMICYILPAARYYRQALRLRQRILIGLLRNYQNSVNISNEYIFTMADLAQ